MEDLLNSFFGPIFFFHPPFSFNQTQSLPMADKAGGWFGGRPSGSVKPKSRGVQVVFGGTMSENGVETKYFSFTKYGGSQEARAAADAWRATQSFKRGETMNCVRKDPDDPDSLIMHLSTGAETHIPADRYDELSQHAWCALQSAPTMTPYAVSSKGVRMHRLLTSPSAGLEVDHINGDGLDNRSANLHNVTRQQNTNNQRMRCDNKTGLNGISWNRKNRSFIVKWQENKKQYTKSFYVGDADDSRFGKVQKRKAKKYRNDIYRRIGNTNGVRSKR